MDNVPEETLDTARETSSAKGKMVPTARDELSNPAEEREQILSQEGFFDFDFDFDLRHRGPTITGQAQCA